MAKTQSDFYDWVDAALSNWGTDYQSMLTALRRLVAAAPDYVIAMQEIKARQVALPPAEIDDAQASGQVAELYEAEEPQETAEHFEAEESEQEIRDPGEAAKMAAAQITAPIIQQFQEEYSELAALITPEQLTAAATAATAVAISEIY